MKNDKGAITYDNCDICDCEYGSSSCITCNDYIKPNITEFFMPMIPPLKTHQEKRASFVNGKPVFYETAELKAVRVKLQDHLGQHVPDKKYTGAIRLITKWCFPMTGKHKNGEFKTTKPDTDNLQKMLKDVMTHLGFWTDDALVASEITEKFWTDKPGIYIRIEEL